MCGQKVICRIGSLETSREAVNPLPGSYLPYRQLRKGILISVLRDVCYLPYRQLRKLNVKFTTGGIRYLPYRQLRNVIAKIA